MIKIETAIVAAAVTLIAGCAAPRLAPDAQGISFPAREASYRHDGIVVSRETLRQIRPGLDKDQVRQILGNPHFTEGLFFVKDWNYLIDLVMPQGDRQDCQLQLQFDDDAKLAATHWQTAACAAAVGLPEASAASPPPAQAAATTTAAPRSESLSLHGLLFPYARSTLADLPAKDLARLEEFATSVSSRAQQVREITIYGHSDRLGPPERRQQRSLLRARAVAEVFVRRGIDPQRITIVAKGAVEPVTDCLEPRPYTQLLGCLTPDRRVTIAVRLAGD